jgi:hypothetical protein
MSTVCQRCQGIIENNQPSDMDYFQHLTHADYKDCFNAVHKMLHVELNAAKLERERRDSAIVELYGQVALDAIYERTKRP